MSQPNNLDCVSVNRVSAQLYVLQFHDQNTLIQIVPRVDITDRPEADAKALLDFLEKITKAVYEAIPDDEFPSNVEPQETLDETVIEPF